MNKEEKEAIEEIKLQIQNDKEDLPYSEECIKYKQTILDLIEKQKNRIASLEKQIKLMQSCDLAKVIKGQQNRIEKQQEEIEQLANGIRVLGTNPDITTEEIIKEFTEKPITEEYMEEFESRYISKDKVLKAIGYEENDEEYDRLKQDDEKLLAILDTLYSEVCRLEDIEDKKVEVAVDFIEEKRDKYWQDKIRNILKKYEKRPLEDGICFYKEIEKLLEEN